MDEFIEQLRLKMIELGPIDDEGAKKAREDMDRRLAALSLDPHDAVKQMEEGIKKHNVEKMKFADLRCMNTVLLKSSVGLMLFALAMIFYDNFLFDKNKYFFYLRIGLMIIQLIWIPTQIILIYFQWKRIREIRKLWRKL
jgi:hypothetical protein